MGFLFTRSLLTIHPLKLLPMLILAMKLEEKLQYGGLQSARNHNL